MSRSGATITAGRWLRFDRESAARSSFLMSIPITGGAALYKGVELVPERRDPERVRRRRSSGASSRPWISGFIAIAFLLRFVRTHSFRPFVIYRVVLGVAVIIIFATGIR